MHGKRRANFFWPYSNPILQNIRWSVSHMKCIGQGGHAYSFALHWLAWCPLSCHLTPMQQGEGGISLQESSPAFAPTLGQENLTVPNDFPGSKQIDGGMWVVCGPKVGMYAHILNTRTIFHMPALECLVLKCWLFLTKQNKMAWPLHPTL